MSAVPALARMEMMVRARNVDAMTRASFTVDRCLQAGALAFGASVRVTTSSGYLPLATDPSLDDLVHANAVGLVGPARVQRDAGHLSWSTDPGSAANV